MKKQSKKEPLLNFEWAGRTMIQPVIGVKGGRSPA